MPELQDDERFTTQMLRARNQAELVELLQPAFSKKPASWWLAEMDRRGVPCSPIHTYPEILENEQVDHMNLVQPLELPNGVTTRTTAYPVAMTDYQFEVYRAPPELGADNEEVFEDWLTPESGRTEGSAT